MVASRRERHTAHLPPAADLMPHGHPSPPLLLLRCPSRRDLYNSMNKPLTGGVPTQLGLFTDLTDL